MRGLTGEGIAWAITAYHASNWHPLTWLSHMLDCQLYGLKPGGHHLTNVLLHAAAAMLLFLVLRRMTGALWPSAWVAAVFAIHPLRVESVAWVAERKDVLSGLFFMLTLWFYARYAERPASWGRYLSVVAAFALGLTAKPMLVTLPFVLLLLDYWPLGRLGPLRAGSREDEANSPRPDRLFVRLVVEKIPLFVLAAASCAVTLAAQRDAIQTLEQIAFPWRVANAAVAYVAYLGKMFYPAGLAVLYPLPDRPAADLESGCRGDRAVGDFHGRLRRQAEVPLLAFRVALVSWDAGAGDRIGAGGRSGDGRPLHVFDADRALHRDCLGRRAGSRLLALSSLGDSRPSRRWWWRG